MFVKKSIDNLSLVSCRDLNAIQSLLGGDSPADMHVVREMHTFDASNSVGSPQNCKETASSSIATPSSYSESSLDGKSNRSHDCLTSSRSLSKKRVNIRSDFLHERHQSTSITANYEEMESGGDTASGLNDTADLERNCSISRYNTMSSVKTDSYLTMTGTIKRGRKKGQSVDLQLNMSLDELERINVAALTAVANTATKKASSCFVCSRTMGLHILLLSLLCLPFVTVVTSVYSFYIGTLTWYNMFNYFSEEKSYAHKLFVSPLLVLLYPLLIVLCTLGLGIYAGFVQLSVCFSSWINEIGDIEKGFYGWLCSFLRMSDCSPYEVVILMDLKLHPEEGGDDCGVLPTAASSTEELSL